MKYAALFRHLLPLNLSAKRVVFIAKAKAAPKASDEEKKAAAAEGVPLHGETISNQKTIFLTQQYTLDCYEYI